MVIDQKLADELRGRAQSGDIAILRSVELKSLYDQLKTLPNNQKRDFGQAVNSLKNELTELLVSAQQSYEQLAPIDITAPWDVNSSKPEFLPASSGSIHPLMSDQAEILAIFARMGFSAIESRQIDDDYHMFTSLNFPEGHPARDDYDTFSTEEGLIAPAHTSTMQNRILVDNKHLLEKGEPIAFVIPGRVFRNEDVDATHEHTLSQLEGVYVNKGIHAGHLLATLKTFLQEYYQKDLDIKTQPFYFPFTEPSFEVNMSCPFCDKAGCSICKQSGWIEILGCGMIHPNVLKMAGIDSAVYTGFAWGVGTMRLTMMKYGIEDVRLFQSAKLDFLRKFS